MTGCADGVRGLSLDERIAARKPYLEDGGCDCVFVCDKNCPPVLPTDPPGTDGLHRQIALSKQADGGVSLIFVVPASRGSNCTLDGGSPSTPGEHVIPNPYCLQVLRLRACA